jgi:4-hydroxy-3-methylbut-2-enyl diphosphate reductase
LKIVIADKLGFCSGVRKVIACAEDALRRYGRAQIVGELIHNEQEMERLQKLGLIVAPSHGQLDDSLPVLIRAHGEPRRIHEKLAKFQLISCVCPVVEAAIEAVKRFEERGKELIIAGDAAHPEVIALRGYCRTSWTVDNIKDVEALPEMAAPALLAQTSLDPELFFELSEALQRRFPTLEIADTTCNVIAGHREAVKNFVQNVDAVLVLGGRNSSNTRTLVRIAAKYRPTYHISSPEEARALDLSEVKILGITAGASTPMRIVEETIALLRSLHGGGDS